MKKEQLKNGLIQVLFFALVLIVNNLMKLIPQDRKKIAGNLLDALTSIQQKDCYYQAFLEPLSKKYHEIYGSYPVLFLSLEDIEGSGYNTSNLTENDLWCFAGRFTKDCGLMESYWQNVNEIAEYYKIPYLKSHVLQKSYCRFHPQPYVKIFIQNKMKGDTIYPVICKLSKEWEKEPERHAKIFLYAEDEEDLYETLNIWDNNSGYLYTWIYSQEYPIEYLTDITFEE